MSDIHAETEQDSHHVRLRVAESPVVYINGRPLNAYWVNFRDVTREEAAVLKSVALRLGGKVEVDGKVIG